jgi:hypothetical protein
MPFDLPPVSLFDVLRADRCRAAEVREASISKPEPLEDADHEHGEGAPEPIDTPLTPRTGTLRLSTV